MNKTRFPLELSFWVFSLLILALTEPNGVHYSSCPIAKLGWTWCPGCGLGRSIIHLMHGNLSQSLRQHWLAIPALAIISYRIIQLSHQFILSLKTIKQA
jgi:hypothetical protein